MIVGLDGKRTIYSPQANHEYGDIDSYTKQVIGHINYLFFVDTDTQDMIIRLHESEFVHEIKIPESGFNSSSCSRDKLEKKERQGSIIEYNPYDWSTNNGDMRDHRCGLVHEMAHSDDADQGTLPLLEEKILGTNIPKSEIKAINFEKKIRKKTGDERRFKYGGEAFPAGMLDD